MVDAKSALRAYVTIGIVNILKVSVGLLKAKFAAVEFGPEGMAIFGQLNQLVTIMTPILSICVGAEVVRISARADFSMKEKIQNAVVPALCLIAMMGTVFVVVGIFLWAPISDSTIGSSQPHSYFALISMDSIIFAININVFGCLFIGLKKYETVQKITALSLAVELLSFVYCLKIFSISAGLWSTAISQLIQLLFWIWYVKKLGWLTHFSLPRQFIQNVRSLTKKSSVVFYTQTLTAFWPLILRSHTIHSTNLKTTGLLHALMSISSILTATASQLFFSKMFPQIAESRDAEKRKNIMVGYLIVSLLIFIPIASFVITFCEPFVTLAFSNEFRASAPGIPTMLLGDIGFIVLTAYSAKLNSSGNFRNLGLFWTLYYLTLYGLSVIAIHYFGFLGAPIAYTTTSFIFVAIVAHTLRQSLRAEATSIRRITFVMCPLLFVQVFIRSGQESLTHFLATPHLSLSFVISATLSFLSYISFRHRMRGSSLASREK